MPTDLWSILSFFATLVITVGVTFYLKDHLLRIREYARLRAKLERIAGKHATILYGPGAQPFQIQEIDRHGITIQNELQTVFIPATRLLQSDVVLPSCKNYEEARLAKAQEDMERSIQMMMPAMFDEIMPRLAEATKKYFLDDLLEGGGEFSAAIGFKMQKMLSDEGYEIRKK